MQKYHKLTRQIGFSYVSMLLILFFSPILIYFLTRYLTVEQYGAYALIAVTVQIAIVLIELGLSQYITTTSSAMKYKEKIESFFSLVGFEIVLFVLLTIIFFTTPLQMYVLGLLKLEMYSFEFKIALAIILFGLLIRLYSSYFAANKRLELYSLISVLSKSLWIVFIIIFVFFFKKLVLFESMALWFFGIFLTFLVCFFYSRKDFINFIKSRRISLKYIKKGIIFGAPLIFFYMGTYMIVMADRYILTYYTTLSLVGIYTLAYSICSIISSFGTTISIVIYPYIAEAWNKKEDHNVLYNASFKYNFMVVLPSIVGIYVLRKPLITLISGVKYIDSSKVIPLLILFPLLSSLIYLFYQNLLLRKKTKKIGLIYLVGGGFNILLNFILIPFYGMYGAAIATIVTYAFMFFVMYAFCCRHIKLNFKFIGIWQMIMASLFMLVFLYFMNPLVLWTKLFTIIAGALLYFSLLFFFGFFSKKELAIVRKFLGKTLLIKCR